MVIIAILIFIYPIIATLGWWSQWRKANKLQKIVDKASPLIDGIEDKNKKIESLTMQIETVRKELDHQIYFQSVNNRVINNNRITPYSKTSPDLKYSIKDIQEEKDYFVEWVHKGTKFNLILKHRSRGYVDYEPTCTYVNKGWKSPEIIKENAQCCTLKIGDAYIYMYAPANGIVYYSEKPKLKDNDIILYIESDEEKISLYEKEIIKQSILEKQKRKQLEKLAAQELVNEGVLFPEANKRPPIPKEVADTVWNRDGGRCVYCGSTENLHFDHIIPFSKGGATNVENLQLLCQKCNLEKSNKIG